MKTAAELKVEISRQDLAIKRAREDLRQARKRLLEARCRKADLKRELRLAHKP